MGFDALPLARYPVTEIDSVAEDGEELAAEDYEFDVTAGLLYRLCDDEQTRWRARKVTAVYTGGYVSLTDLPDAIERACITLVKAYRSSAKRDPSLRSEQIDGVWSGTYWVGSVPGASGLP